MVDIHCHLLPGIDDGPATLDEALKMAEAARRLGGRLTLATGCDFHLNLQNLKALEQNPAAYTINQKNYLLVEFSEFSIPPSLDQTLHELQLARLTPVITHPERNGIIRSDR